MHLLATTLSLLLLAPVAATEGNPLGALLKAQYAHVSGDHEYALELVDAVLRGESMHTEAAWLKIEVMRDKQARDLMPSSTGYLDLVRELTRFTERFPQDYRFPKAMGVLIIDEPRVSRLIELDDPEVYLHTALSLMKDETPVGERSDTWYYLGRRYYLQGLYYDSFNAFREVCELEPELNWALYYAAQAAEACHRLRTALVYYRRFMAAAMADGVGLDLPVVRNINIIQAVIADDETAMDRLVAELSGKYDRDETFLVAARLMKARRGKRCLRILEVVPQDQRDLGYYRMYTEVMADNHHYGDLYRSLVPLLSMEETAAMKTHLVDAAVEAAFLDHNFKAVESLAKRYGEEPALAIKLQLMASFAAILDRDDLEIWTNFKANGGPDNLSDGFRRDVTQHGIQAMALQHLVNSHMGRRDWQGALKVLENKDIRANRNILRSDLAVILALGGSPVRAFEVYDELIKEQPNRKDLLNNYGYFLAEAGMHLDKARIMVEKALELDPTNSDYLDSLAWVLHKNGNNLAAEPALRLALKAQPKDPEKLDHLGDILSAKGEVEEARRYWSKAMEHTDRRYLDILDKLDPAK